MSTPRMLLVQGDETPPGQMGVVWTFRCGMTMAGSRCLSWFNMFGDLDGLGVTAKAIDAGWRLDRYEDGWLCPGCVRHRDESTEMLRAIGQRREP